MTGSFKLVKLITSVFFLGMYFYANAATGGWFACPHCKGQHSVTACCCGCPAVFPLNGDSYLCCENEGCTAGYNVIQDTIVFTTFAPESYNFNQESQQNVCLLYSKHPSICPGHQELYKLFGGQSLFHSNMEQRATSAHCYCPKLINSLTFHVLT